MQKCVDGDAGIFNPQKVFEFMNEIQKQEDPKAYEPEIVQKIEKQK